MRTLILKDKDIRDDELDSLIHNISSFYVKSLPYQMSLIDYTVEEKDYSSISYENYYDGYYGISESVISAEMARINYEYGSKFDQVVYLIHEDKWLPASEELQEEAGITGASDNLWGWNLSYAYQGYECQQVRWDSENPANTFGTLNHEHTHSFDSYIYRKLGTVIEKSLGIKDFDKEVVHGKGDDYTYIGRKDGRENGEVLGKLEKQLETAWAKARLQYELEQKPTPELIKSASGIFKLMSGMVSKFVEEMRNRNYAAKHFDVPIKKSCITNK